MAKLTVPIRVDALEEAKAHAKEYYDKGYQQGRADAISEFIKLADSIRFAKKLQGISCDWWEAMCEAQEKMKEKNKCN